jgi:hypothetical protein
VHITKTRTDKDGTDGCSQARTLAGRPDPDKPACRERDGVSGVAEPGRYEIRVEGVLDGRWTTWFEGLEIDSDGRQTIISGPVADQAALRGLLNKVGDLGLVLISVSRSDPD